MKPKKHRNVISKANLLKLLKKHKKIKIVTFSASNPENVDRERILTFSGTAMVRYQTQRWESTDGNWRLMDDWKFSRYGKCCFSFNLDTTWCWSKKLNKSYTRKVTGPVSKRLVNAMFRHDKGCIYIAEVYVGKNFKERVA